MVRETEEEAKGRRAVDTLQLWFDNAHEHMANCSDELPEDVVRVSCRVDKDGNTTSIVVAVRGEQAAKVEEMLNKLAAEE